MLLLEIISAFVQNPERAVPRTPRHLTKIRIKFLVSILDLVRKYSQILSGKNRA
jgi:hypothetical protein